MKEKRLIYLDLLRIFAVTAVIVIHVSGQNWHTTQPGSAQWLIFNLFDSVSRWAVPVFVMISGSLFLGGSHGIKYIVKNNVLRMITAFVFWSAVYVLLDFLDGKCKNFSECFTEFANGHYHLWFLFVISGLYLLVPFFKKAVSTERLMKYFLIITFIFSVALPHITNIMSVFSPYWYRILLNLSSRTNMLMLKGYPFYFVLGYYLRGKEFSKKKRAVIYILGFSGAAGIFIFSTLVSEYLKKPNTVFLDNFTFGCTLLSVSVFVFFKYISEKINFSEKAQKIILRLSKYSFGVYLCHVIIIDRLKVWGLTTLSLNPAGAVLLISAITAALSLIISAVLNSIPGIRKYIV